MAKNPLRKTAATGASGMGMRQGDQVKRKRQSDDEYYASRKYSGGGLALPPGYTGNWPPVVTSSLDMRGFHVYDVAAPRQGIMGLNDAVTRGYVDALGTNIYHTITSGIATQINGGHAATPQEALNNIADAVTGGATVKDGDLIYVASDGTAAHDIYIGWYVYEEKTPLWRTIGSAIGGGGGGGIVLPRLWYRDLLTDPQPVGDQVGDLDMVGQNNNIQFNVWDGQRWTLLLGESQIKAWIAAGSLFQGTVTTKADIAGLPVPDATNRGFYWSWTGASNTGVVDADFPGGGFTATLQVGDWIQSDGTNYIHVPGDLMSKLRWEQVGSFRTWQDGPYEQGSLVYHNGKYYRATAGVATGDAEPGAPAGKWADISQQFGIEDMTDVEDFNVMTLPNGSMLIWDIMELEFKCRMIEMDDISNYEESAAGLVDGDLMVWDDTAKHWTNKRPAIAQTGGGVPVGAIITYASITPPTGYLLCDGSQFNAVTYPDLYAVLGGDKVPDLRGQFIRGAATAGQVGQAHSWSTALPQGAKTGRAGEHDHGGNTAELAQQRLTTTMEGSGHRHWYTDPLLGRTNEGVDAGGGSNRAHPKADGQQTWTDGSDRDAVGGHTHVFNIPAHKHGIPTQSDHEHTLTGFDTETAPAHIYMAYMIKAEP